MTPTRILIGQALIVVAIVVGGLWAATQWAAAMLGHQPRLGLPWFEVADLPVYYPWRLFQWWYAFEPYALGVFIWAGTLAAAAGLAGALVAIAGSVWRARQTRIVTTYGSARWANAKEVRAAGLFDPRASTRALQEGRAHLQEAMAPAPAAAAPAGGDLAGGRLGPRTVVALLAGIFLLVVTASTVVAVHLARQPPEEGGGPGLEEARAEVAAGDLAGAAALLSGSSSPTRRPTGPGSCSIAASRRPVWSQAATPSPASGSRARPVARARRRRSSTTRWRSRSSTCPRSGAG